MFENTSLEYEDLGWTGLTKSEIKTILDSGYNPLGDRTEIEKDNPGLREYMLMSRATEYMYFAARILLNKEISPMQACILHCLWTHSFPQLIGSRGLGKSFLLAGYAVLRAAIMQGTKIVCVGAGFRQSKFIHAYADEMYRNSPILRSIFKEDKDGSRYDTDVITLTLGRSKISFIPMGDGSKIRGQRANIVISDEFNSLNTEIYEIVVNNFAAVEMEPIKNMQKKSKIKILTELGKEIPFELSDAGFKNQSIIAGTMGFEHEPLYSYWKKYKEIIDSKGKSMGQTFENASALKLSYKDFCIMRLPYELIPEGYMADEIIEKAKATIHIGAYNSEYGCVPVKDTIGFFRRSIIDQCVANDNAVDKEGWPSWCPKSFDPILKGYKNSTYVMGVDPAFGSENGKDSDNFSIVILEVYPNHQRVVYCWTINRSELRAIDPKANYYAYCARHMRNLMTQFNCRSIGIDAQGGGTALAEALHDEDSLRPGEVPYWPVIDDKKPSITDDMAGDHILHMIQFSNYQWTSEANHSLRKDLEAKTLLFPRYNSVLLGLAYEGKNGPQEEDNILNIEEIKNELATIVMTKTATRERWDTPQIKTDSNKIGRLRKDRYSALLIANYLARQINREMMAEALMTEHAGVVGSVKKVDEYELDYFGNAELAKQIGSVPYKAVRR
jgi:hypothetical protein